MARKTNTARKTKTAPAEIVEIEAAVPVETELTPNRSVVPTRWVKAYAQSQLKGTCGDRIAYQLDEITKTDGKADLAKIRELGAANGIDVDLRWGTRNVGMQRMNLGNVLRGRIKRGEPVHLA